jgi:hypothetical protein
MPSLKRSRTAKGYPKLLNDEMVIPFYLANGVTREEANDWNISDVLQIGARFYAANMLYHIQNGSVPKLVGTSN